MSGWFYEEKGQQRGPVSEDELRRLISSGPLSSKNLVWKDGLGDWVPANTLPEFGAEQTAAPNTPSPSSPPSSSSTQNVPPGHYQPAVAAYDSGTSVSGMAIASLVSGVLGLSCCLPFIGPALAIIFGHLALGGIKASKGRLLGSGMAIAGLILGYLNLVMHLVVTFLMFLGAAEESGRTFSEEVKEFELGELWDLVDPEEAAGEGDGVEDEARIPFDPEPEGDLQ